MFVSIIKYSRKCSSFYFLIMSQDNTYKICLLIKLDVRHQGQKNKTTQCQSKLQAVEIPLKSSSCAWPN